MKAEAKKILERARETGWLMEPDARALLDLYGLPMGRHAFVRNEDEAVIAAAMIGYPVVMKVVSPEIVHKTDVGGVEVGIGVQDAMLAAFLRMKKLPGFRGVLLDRMLSGIEIFVGSRVDGQFGPVVLAGIGGTAVEVYRDVKVLMAPLARREAMNALQSLRGAKLLTGYRGKAPANLASVARLLVLFSEMAADLGAAIDSIDLNPVMCGPRKALIADARVMLK